MGETPKGANGEEPARKRKRPQQAASIAAMLVNGKGLLMEVDWMLLSASGYLQSNHIGVNHQSHHWKGCDAHDVQGQQ